MPVIRDLQCPSCKGVFEHFFMRMDDPPLRFCCLCGYDTHSDSAGMSSMPSAPHIQNVPVVKGVDYTYRAMEESSAHNVKLAAEALGVSEADVSDLKITNMKDNLREGDTAAVEVRNDVSRTIEAAPNAFGFQGGASNGMGYAAAAHSGPNAYAGARAAGMLRSIHSQENRASGGVVLPTVETARRGTGTKF